MYNIHSNSTHRMLYIYIKYGEITEKFSFHLCCIFAAKPILLMEPGTKIMDQNNDGMVLSCGIKHAYPPPDIIWSMMTVPSEGFIVLHESTNHSDYQLYRNGSIELYHHFLFEMGNITVMCSASNLYGSIKKKFYVWDKAAFEQGNSSASCLS